MPSLLPIIAVNARWYCSSAHSIRSSRTIICSSWARGIVTVGCIGVRLGLCLFIVPFVDICEYWQQLSCVSPRQIPCDIASVLNHVWDNRVERGRGGYCSWGWPDVGEIILQVDVNAVADFVPAVIIVGI